MTESVAVWRRSRFCDSNTCVEVARFADTVAMRDAKNPERGPLRFSISSWDAFTAGVRLGEFDR
jgi:hypothetical protein